MKRTTNPTRTSEKQVALAAALALAALVAGCDYLPFGFTPIKEITAAPASFEGKEVKIQGKVKDVTKVPLFGIRMYVLQDGTGDVAVTTEEDLPALGQRLAVKGVGESAAIIGGQALGFHIREQKRLPVW